MQTNILQFFKVLLVRGIIIFYIGALVSQSFVIIQYGISKIWIQQGIKQKV